MEGIVLKAIDFRERQRIVTIFTPDEGLITVFISRISPKNPERINLSTPLTRADWQVKVRKNDLWSLQDASILDLHLPLRQNFDRLQAARLMIERVLKTQLPHKPAPKLYALFKTFLKSLTTTENPALLELTFALKLMRHEGLLSLSANCSSCEKNLSFHFAFGENFCTSCAPPNATALTPDQWKQMMKLLSMRSFKNLEAEPLEKTLLEITQFQ